MRRKREIDNPMKKLGAIFREVWGEYLPISGRRANFPRTREKTTLYSREKSRVRCRQIEEKQRASMSAEFRRNPELLERASVSLELDRCPNCSSKNISRRGTRKKKYETLQRYVCRDCKRSFVPPKAKGKSFPLKIILEGLSYYHIGYSAEESCRRLKEDSGLDVKPSTLYDWVREFEPLCRYGRLRKYGLKMYTPNQTIQSVHLFHRQVYDFSVHRAKLALALQENKHGKFRNLREFLEAVQAECPHQLFKEGERASDLKVNFDLHKVVLRGKRNFATRIAGLALQAVSDNKMRHQALQRFMLCNDSVTVAVEVPVYMDEWDIRHMEDELGFKIPIRFGNNGKDSGQRPGSTSAASITGHIDILQIRNGAVHILDYKPKASAGKTKSAMTQLTLYAIALSRLTGLRLYDFKCAWFDQNDYFEFFPLHVVYKLGKSPKKEDPNQMKLEMTGK